MNIQDVNIIPTGENVVINPVPLPKTKSLIILPNPKKSDLIQYRKGVVVARGEGTPDIEMQVKHKDMVMFPKNRGVHITIKDQEFIIIKQSSIVSVL